MRVRPKATAQPSGLARRFDLGLASFDLKCWYIHPLKYESGAGQCDLSNVGEKRLIGEEGGRADVSRAQKAQLNLFRSNMGNGRRGQHSVDGGSSRWSRREDLQLNGGARLADLDEAESFEDDSLDFLAIDEGAVSTVQIFDVPATVFEVDACMFARHERIVKANTTFLATSEKEGCTEGDAVALPRTVRPMHEDCPDAPAQVQGAYRGLVRESAVKRIRFREFTWRVTCARSWIANDAAKTEIEHPGQDDDDGQ